jgi:hypothetical protein
MFVGHIAMGYSNVDTYRLPVAGGWLYASVVISSGITSITQTFVPDTNANAAEMPR